MDSIFLTGLSAQITSSHLKNYSIIKKLWISFNKKLPGLRKENSEREWVKYGVTYRDNTGYRYLASINECELNSSPHTFITKSIPEGEYLCFAHHGAMTEISTTINRIYREILPTIDTKIIPDNKIGFFHIERYDEKFHFNATDSALSILVPVEY